MGFSRVVVQRLRAFPGSNPNTTWNTVATSPTFSPTEQRCLLRFDGSALSLWLAAATGALSLQPAASSIAPLWAPHGSNNRKSPNAGRPRIKDEDRPQQTPLGTLQLLARADKAGSQSGTLCRWLHRRDGETAVCRIDGVLSPAKNTAPPPRRTLVPPPWKSASVSTILCAAIWNAAPDCP